MGSLWFFQCSKSYLSLTHAAFFKIILFCLLILRILFFLCSFWSSKASSLKSSTVRSHYLRPTISSVLLSTHQCGFRSHGLFLLLCLDLPWATRVIQKKVAQGHAGHSLPLIPRINCFLISGNDSGKWACQIFATPLMNRSASASEPTHLVADVVWWAGLGTASQILILLGCRGLFWIMRAFLIYQSSCAQKLWMYFDKHFLNSH